LVMPTVRFFCRLVLVGGAGAQHGVHDVDPPAGEADEGGVGEDLLHRPGSPARRKVTGV
jgi:hypothetical protein